MSKWFDIKVYWNYEWGKRVSRYSFRCETEQEALADAKDVYKERLHLIEKFEITEDVLND